jgi:amino acid transporter
MSAPKSIVNGVIAAILIGFAFFLGLLYSMNGNIDGAVNGITSQPVINIFDMAFTDKDGNRILAGSLTMSILLLINVYLGGFSHMTVTSRIIFAMSRDGALPGSKYIYGVNKKLQLPVKSIILTFTVASILCLLPLINDTAFDAITGISTIGY